MKQVEIPNDYFFKMACKDYYNWQTALIREFIQNSVDAGASEIRFSHEGEYLTVADDGCGMDMTVIVNALLTLGGTAKKSDVSVGGLGKAKEILYFSWPEWEIKTKGIWIKGEGCRYDVKATTYQGGVKSRIKIGDKIPQLEHIIEGYVKLCCLTRTLVYVNDEIITNGNVQYGKKTSRIEGLGDLYENLLSDTNQVIVHAHGLFMFSNYSVLDKGYIFNITQPSYECLTANRDGFIGAWNDQFNRMIGEVAVDTESSQLRKEHIIYVQGLRNHSISTSSEDTLEKVRTTPLGAAIAGMSNKTVEEITFDDVHQFMASGYAMTEDLIDKSTGRKLRSLVKKAKASKLFDACLKWYKDQFPEGFIIVSEEEVTSGLISSLYTRETLQLTILWKRIVDSLAKMEGIENDNYGYGIVIANDTIARCQDRYLLYNPRVFSPLSWEEVAVKMLIAATEELVHLRGYSYHNETFKCVFSHVLERVLRERTFVDDFLSHIRKVRKDLTK